MTTLYRASNDDFLRQGCCFAETIETAREYMHNPGFGGSKLWSCSVSPSESEVIDLTVYSVAELAEMLGMSDPVAIGTDEWVASSYCVIDALAERGYQWALVPESYPRDTRTWVLVGANEPELTEVR